MKIQRVTDVIQYSNRVNEKDGTDGKSDGRQQNADQQGKDKKDDAEPRSFSVNDQTVAQAVDHFGKDEMTRSAGLMAEVSGSGPGLRVTLKDGSGAVVRQFTGEEFLELREAAVNQGNTRGKILDQKF